MPRLIVLSAGASSIQGLGRYGAQRYGIAPGGAMDRLSLAEANALAGIPSGAAALEIGPLPARFAVEGGVIRFAFTGAARDVFVDDRRVALGTTVTARSGQVITVRGAIGGLFSYLSLEGGVQGTARAVRPDGTIVEPPTGNAARSFILAAGDTIMAEAAKDEPERELRLHTRNASSIRVVLGPQLDYFDEAGIGLFLSTSWSVSHAANRMAYLLEGARVPLARGHNIVSDGTVTGHIQIAGSGQPVVIMCDRGTVGGYPKIATIVTADLGRFAQMPAGRTFTFESVSVLEAQILAREFAFTLDNVKPRVEVVAPFEFSTEALLASNVAGEAYDAVASEIFATAGQDAEPELRGAA